MNRKTTFLKSLAAIVMLLASTCFVHAQLLVENFEYPIATVLTTGTTADATTGWIGHSGSGTNNIPVADGLVYSGYIGSGVGGAASLLASGQDVNKLFTSQTSGSVYVAFLANVKNSGATGDYFLHVGPSPISTTFRGRVFVRKNESNKVAFGISHAATTPVMSDFVYDLNVTYLIVLKHTIVDGATNDVTSIFVNPTPGGAEPSTGWITATDTGADLAGVASVALRQGTTANNVNVIVDGIRVATTWALAVAASGPTNPIVATPTFSPSTGNYTTTQSVTIATTTDGASIYYTTNGTEPTQASRLFTGPVNVGSTTMLRARAYMPGMDASAVASATYTFPTGVANIATLRQHTSGFYRLTGEAVLTLKTATRNAKYIQDATAGILIDDAVGVITTVYNPGDGITGVTGTLAVFNGMLQFTPVADPGAATSTGNTVVPVVVPLAEIINHPAKLVTVKNAIITGTGNFVASTNYNLNGAANPVLRVAYADLPYVGQPIPTTEQDITGVVLVFNTTAQLVPRTLADFNTSTGLAKLSADYKVFASAGALMVVSPKVERLEVYNTLGQLVHASLLQAGMNSVQVPEGLLIVKIGNQVAKVMN